MEDQFVFIYAENRNVKQFYHSIESMFIIPYHIINFIIILKIFHRHPFYDKSHMFINIIIIILTIIFHIRYFIPQL